MNPRKRQSRQGWTTPGLRVTLAVTNCRREKQIEYNRQYNITPHSVTRAIEESLALNYKAKELEAGIIRESGGDYDVVEVLRELEEEMQEAAAIINAGGPPDVEKLKAVMMKHGLVPAPPPISNAR